MALPSAAAPAGPGRPWEGAVGPYVARQVFELAAQRELESFEVECAMVEVRAGILGFSFPPPDINCRESPWMGSWRAGIPLRSLCEHFLCA